ncbi:hypothetical protein Tco_1531312 [Tanacetum coccineum]
MGIGTRPEEVDAAATTMACSIFTTPFVYLGVKVGGVMYGIKYWDDVAAKVPYHLSKWKLKTLSISGRLTLIKSVLTFIPLYHMSVFKVLSGVLKLLESIRRNFFNGVDSSERKMVWMSWNKVLAFKKYDGLGVSTIYGEDGALNSPSSLSKRSPWLDIIREVIVLRTKGINLLDLIRKKVGNGLNTLCWEDPWLDDLALKHKFPRLYDLDNYKQITVIEKINHASMVDTFRRAPRGGVEEEQLGFLLSRMDGLILTNIHDCWVRSLEATCEFYVKSIRQLIDDSILPKEEVATRTRDPKPDLSFDTPASPESMSGLACASSAETLFFATWLVPGHVLSCDVVGMGGLLTQDDLNDLIVKYNIPRDLHPRLPSEDFVMPDISAPNAIGVYHRIFDFSGVLIPFPTFLLSLIKHYKVHFSSWVLWGSTRSCMKGWKSCFFLIDQRAIPNYMPWRHPSSAIDDPKPPVGSYNQEDVHRLSAHVVKLRDIPKEGGLWIFMIFFTSLSGPELRFRRNFIMISGLPYKGSLSIAPPVAADVAIPDLTPEDLAAGTPSVKVMAKAEASKKQKASISGVAPSHVAKCTRSAIAQSSRSTTRPNLFATNSNEESDDDEDACVEIHLITPIWSAIVIPTEGNQIGGFVPPVAEGPSIRGKAIMNDDADAPSEGAIRSRSSTGPVPSFQDLSSDAIHMDFFPFFSWSLLCHLS